MNPEIVDNIKEQVLKHFGCETWEEFVEDGYEIDGEEVEAILNKDFGLHNYVDFGGSKEKSDFEVANGWLIEKLIVVPYLSEGRNSDSDVLATHNLTEIADISVSSEGAKLYKKTKAYEYAYLLFNMGEAQLSLHRF